jgi:DNA polymerase (family 10)
MKNREIADIFEHMADILEFQGDNLFRVNSYKKAARILNDLAEDIEILSKEDRLREIPGIGEGMAEKIIQYLEKGVIDKYEEIKKGVPDGLIKMLAIPGMGPKTAALIYKELHIKNIEELEKAIEEEKLRELPGMGEKKEENILRGIRLLKESGGRILLGVALPVANEMVASLKNKGVLLAGYAGSLRRMRETIGDIDILAGAEDGNNIIKSFVSQPGVRNVIVSGDTKASIIVENGVQVDLRVVSPDCFGSAMQYFTGSKAHNVHLREIAKAKGLKLNEYGLFKGEKKVSGESEEDIYQILGMDWIPPVLREDRGEIEAAISRKLPELVAEKDIRGDLHVHSKWSDGTTTIEEIAKAAKEKGYSYIAITDHSQSLKIAGGLTPEEMEEQIEEIRKINKKLKDFKILCGCEVDIKNDGSMDFPDSLLSELDVVLGAIHAGFKQDKKTLTKRILKAMENTNVDIIVHPTGRLIGARDPYDVDMDAVLKAAKDTSTALEINCYYDRLDLNEIWARKGKEIGVKFALGTDSHHIDQLWMMQLGVGIARRSWLEKKDILNSIQAGDLIKYLTK